jgi:hypothetical protein
VRNEIITVYFQNIKHVYIHSTLKWHEICVNIPGMLYQVLLAWENDSLSTTDVKMILDTMRVRMCAYSVCAASWLVAYMQIVKQVRVKCSFFSNESIFLESVVL